MALVTRFINLIKPEAPEKFSRVTYNQNLDKIDAGIAKAPLVVTKPDQSIPEGKRPKSFTGLIGTTKGRGGENPDFEPATNETGYGALFFGKDGLPTFEGITGITLTHYTGGTAANEQFACSLAIVEYNLFRIKYRARRLDSGGAYGGWAALYGGISIFVHVEGW